MSLATALGSSLICLIGIGYTILPWGQIYNSVTQTWHLAGGIGWWQGMLACASFGAVLLLLVSTVALLPTPWWRPLAMGIAGVAVVVSSISYILAMKSGTLPVQPLLDAARWSMEINGRLPETVLDAKIVAEVRAGPNVTLALAAALLLLAAIELGSILRRRANTAHPMSQTTRAG